MENNCKLINKCGGCKYNSDQYKESLVKKIKEVQSLIGHYVKVDKIYGMENPYHYRNKVHATFKRLKNGEIISGTYEEGTHNLVKIDSCNIEDELADKIIGTIAKLAKSFKMPIYDEDRRTGVLRHVMIRRGYVSKEIMVVIVTGSKVFPSKANFVKELRKIHPEITTVIHNINDKKTSMVLGDKESTIYGKGYIVDELMGYKFKISSKSFYQINSAQTEVLYKKVLEFADFKGNEEIIDAYCGIGTIGISASKSVKSVIGVELNKAAVKDAIINAKLNEIKNISFVLADASDYMVKLAASGKKIDAVIMDPPRSGSDERFLKSIEILKPEKVIYVSCDPKTLARDLKYITNHGYKAKKAVAVDMFPLTDHVETVVLLSQRKADDYVEVELELDELDVTSAETKATYKEIQEYVLKEHGLKVSNLYISQVKRKCGIEVGENYNLPKSEDSRQPQRPEEKEKAIRDALEHFGMA